jgi:aminoglycoside phosphotransferase (APT) family kinase protein
MAVSWQTTMTIFEAPRDGRPAGNGRICAGGPFAAEPGRPVRVAGAYFTPRGVFGRRADDVRSLRVNVPASFRITAAVIIAAQRNGHRAGPDGRGRYSVAGPPVRSYPGQMLTPPGDLPEAVLATALGRWWGMAVASIEYRAVGWGSHHWEAADTSGSRWFVTADDLANKRLSRREPLAAGFGRLRASLAAARDLRDCGATFVVAPVPAAGGGPLARVGGRFGVAVYPFVDGQSFGWGEFSSPAHRRAVLGLLTALHTAPDAASRHALADDFAVPHRDELEVACDPAGRTRDYGPYARPTSLLIGGHAAPIRRLLARYDELVSRARSQPARRVLTHGEPHPGNTMLTARGWLLIDWDTALVAPPERDLWDLDPGDGSVLGAYADATGVAPRPVLLDLYRLRWDIADIAADVSRFRRPHAGTIEDGQSWELLKSLVERVSG